MGQLKNPEESDFSLLLCSPGPISRTVVAVEQAYLGILLCVHEQLFQLSGNASFVHFISTVKWSSWGNRTKYDPAKSFYSVPLAPSQCVLGPGS